MSRRILLEHPSFVASKNTSLSPSSITHDANTLTPKRRSIFCRKFGERKTYNCMLWTLALYTATATWCFVMYAQRESRYVLRVDETKYVNEVDLFTPKSDEHNPFLTGIYSTKYGTNSKDDGSSNNYSEGSPVATKTVASSKTTEVLIFLVFFPDRDNIDAALRTLDFLQKTVGHLDCGDEGDQDHAVMASISPNSDGKDGNATLTLDGWRREGAPLSLSCDRVHVRLLVLLPPPPADGGPAAKSLRRFRAGAEAIGRKLDRTISLLRASLPFDTMGEALAHMAFHASQTSDLVLPIGADVHPLLPSAALSSTSTPSSLDVDPHAFAAALASTLSRVVGNYGSEGWTETAKRRLAYANLFDWSSLTAGSPAGGNAYRTCDAISCRLFPSRYVVHIATMIGYAGELSLEMMDDLLVNSERVNETQLFQLHARPGPEKNISLPCQLTCSVHDGGIVDEELNVLRRIILPRLQQHNHKRSASLNNCTHDVVFGLVTVPRPHLSTPYVVDTLRSLLYEIDTYSAQRNPKKTSTGLHCDGPVFGIVVQVAGSTESRSNAAALRNLIETSFQNKTHVARVQLIDAPEHLYPPVYGIRQNYNDSQTRVAWRSKQNLDYSALFQATSLMNSKYFMMLEDDVGFNEGFIAKILETEQKHRDTWTALDFADIGFAGKMFRREHLATIGLLMRLFYNEKPCDWLYQKIAWFDRQRWRGLDSKGRPRNFIKTRPSLLSHRGKLSSLAEKQPQK